MQPGNSIPDNQPYYGPGPNEMMVPAGVPVQTQPVTLPQRAMMAVESFANNPGDFLLSFAASTATFIAVKAVLLTVLSATVPLLATSLIAAMLTSGGIAMAKAAKEEGELREQRLQDFQANGFPPTQAELEAALKVDSEAIWRAGAKHAFTSGIVGAAFGFWLNPELPTEISPTEPDKSYADFKEKLMDSYADKEAYNYEQPDGLGAYKLTEAQLVELGYYPVDDTPNVNDWKNESWGTEEGKPQNKAEFIASVELQDGIYGEWMDKKFEGWKPQIEEAYLTDYLNQEVNGTKITPDRLYAGLHQYGFGEIAEDGSIEGGFGEYLTEGGLDDDRQTRSMNQYLEQFGNYQLPDNLQLEATNAELETTEAERKERGAEPAPTVSGGDGAGRTEANARGEGGGDASVSGGAALEEDGVSAHPAAYNKDAIGEVKYVSTDEELAEFNKRWAANASGNTQNATITTPIEPLKTLVEVPSNAQMDENGMVAVLGDKGENVYIPAEQVKAWNEDGSARRYWIGPGVDPDGYMATGVVQKFDFRMASPEDQAHIAEIDKMIAEQNGGSVPDQSENTIVQAVVKEPMMVNSPLASHVIEEPKSFVDRLFELPKEPDNYVEKPEPRYKWVQQIDTAPTESQLEAMKEREARNLSDDLKPSKSPW